MKPLFTILAFCFISLIANATQRTVNNNNNLPGNPGQFTTIQAAISASNPGDTILVAGSPIPYSATLTISQKIVLLGPGYNPDKQNPLTATISGAINLSDNAASGFVIMGLIVNGSISFGSNAYINGATIRRCQINSSIVFNDSSSNVLIAENSMIGGYIYLYTNYNQYDMVLTNNIFSSDGPSFYFEYQLSSTFSPIKAIHNLFINGSVNNPLISSGWTSFMDCSVFTYNMIVENNIFYNVTPLATGGVFANCTFDNNISYSGGTLPALPLSGNGNVGSGNLNNTNPDMVKVLSTTSAISYNGDNLRLAAGSPCIGSATDHSNIGPTGGNYPIYVSTNQYLTGEPPIPEVKSANFVGASSVTPGGSLQIQVKAQTIN